MYMPSDNMSESTLCKLADVTRQTRKRWVGHGLLRARPKDEYSLLDLLELVACKLLFDALGPSEGRDAWRQVREPYGSQLPQAQVDIVFSVSDRRASLVVDHGHLPDLVRHGRLVRVIPIGPEMTRVHEAFGRYRAGQLAADSDGGAAPPEAPHSAAGA
jgi:hypothetical protein